MNLGNNILGFLTVIILVVVVILGAWILSGRETNVVEANEDLEQNL
jgi:hypothetical protein